MQYLFCIFLAFAFLAMTSKAAERSNITDPQLPKPFATPSVFNPPRPIGWPQGIKPIAPPGFQVNVFADKLAPRWMYLLPNGDVLVAEPYNGQITLLRDTLHNGTAGYRSAFLQKLDRPFGIALSASTLYVGCASAVNIFPYKDGDDSIKAAGKKIFALPAFGYNNHWTRNVLVDAAAGKLYASVGSGTNVDTERSDVKDWRRAAILQANLDGSQLRQFAGGLRNPVGLAFEPKTHVLWTVVNERDGLGDGLVPDYLTSVRDNGFYGWPYAYFGPNEDPNHKGERPDLVAKSLVPDCALGSHVAALGLCFYTGKSFPAKYQGGAFVGEHGSWNSSTRVGYKVAYIPFENGKPSGPPQDFLTGFLKDPRGKDVYGRPVGVIVAQDGSLLVADDGAGIIWRVSYSPNQASNKDSHQKGAAKN